MAALPAPFDKLRLPIIGSPLFIVSGPELVIAQCKAGIIGSFPALNARPSGVLDEWLHRITEELAQHNRDNPDRPAAPYASTMCSPIPSMGAVRRMRSTCGPSTMVSPSAALSARYGSSPRPTDRFHSILGPEPLKSERQEAKTGVGAAQSRRASSSSLMAISGGRTAS